MKTFEFKPTTPDDDSQVILDAQNDMEKYLANMSIDFDVENNGIGSYEYWGFKGVDNCINIVIGDHENLQLKIIGNTTFTEESLKQFAENILENIAHTRCLTADHKNETIQQNIMLEQNNFSFNKDSITLTCDLLWTEI
jgi:hypothetical protein